MKTLLTLLLTTTGLAFAGPMPQGEHKLALPEGSYRGHVNNDDKTEAKLLVRPFKQERLGSYLALLIIETKVNMYLVDPLDERSNTNFTMTPIVVTGDGEIGIVNSDPSLVLSIGAEECDGLPEFTIANANSRNQIGFQGSIIFKAGKKADLNWVDFNPGTFKFDAAFNDDKLVVSQLDGNKEATVLITTRESDLNGTFSLREKKPGIFTIKPVSVKNTGAETAEQPKRLAVFLVRPFWGLWTQPIVLVIDPAKENNFTIYHK